MYMLALLYASLWMIWLMRVRLNIFPDKHFISFALFCVAAAFYCFSFSSSSSFFVFVKTNRKRCFCFLLWRLYALTVRMTVFLPWQRSINQETIKCRLEDWIFFCFFCYGGTMKNEKKSKRNKKKIGSLARGGNLILLRTVVYCNKFV